MSQEGSNTSGFDYFDLIYNKGMNQGALVAALSYLDLSQSRGILDKWKEVECGDGTRALILKDPEDAFELYAKEWNNKFNAIVDVLDQAKAQGNAEINSRIAKLFDNLDYVNATLREMYKNAYLTFAGMPCTEKAQEEKRSMDRIIVAASLSLIGFRMIIEKNNPTDVDTLNNEILKLIERITSMVINK